MCGNDRCIEGGMMPKQATVTLDGDEYVITELRSRPNADWRALLEGPFGELVGAIQRLPQMELNSPEDLATVVQGVQSLLLGSIDQVRELVVAYAPDLGEVVEEAYDSEILDAFAEVLGLAFPFGGLIQKVRGLGQESR